VRADEGPDGKRFVSDIGPSPIRLDLGSTPFEQSTGRKTQDELGKPDTTKRIGRQGSPIRTSAAGATTLADAPNVRQGEK